MGTPPEKPVVKVAVKEKQAVKAVKVAPPKKLNCFVMPDKPDKPGLVMISTVRVQDGCYVLGWQAQQTTLLVSDAPEFYGFAKNVLKADLTFSGVFAFCLLVVLVISRAG